MSYKKVTVAISDIKVSCYVRRKLNEDRVLFFAELYEKGADVDPIVITSDFELIDGRHRLEALKLTDHTETKCFIDKEITDRESLIIAALKANEGSALPPSKEDRDHVIIMLLESGAPVSKIVKSLPYPPSLTRKYLKRVKARIIERKVIAAKNAVTDGNLTIRQAAEKYGVDFDLLKDAIRGKRSSRKGKLPIQTMMSALSTRYRGHSQRNRKSLESLLDALEDGEVSPKEALQFLAKLRKLNQRVMRTCESWEERFEDAIKRLQNESD